MTDPQFSSARDPTPNLYRNQFALRHLFLLMAIFAVGLFAFSLFSRGMMPGKFLNAARDGDLTSLRSYVESGVDINYRDEWSTTGIMMSSSNGHTDCVQFLLESGADPNERSRLGRTPLIWAALSGRIETVRLLIENGAITTVVDSKGLTATDYAQQNGHAQLAAFLTTQ